MVKLNQIIAVVNGKKTEVKKDLTAVHRKCGQTELFNGLVRNYSPLDEEGEVLPAESKAIQFTAQEALDEAKKLLTDMFNVVATQDEGNTKARADVVVDGTKVLTEVPVTYLLFLEKQLLDVEKFVDSLPILDIGTTWRFDDNQGVYVSDSTYTNRTKKVLQHKILYEATKEHPAQIEKWTEDVNVGTWKTQKFSGAISKVDRDRILVKVKALQEAVKFAREEANSLEVEEKKVGEQVFNYLFST